MKNLPKVIGICCTFRRFKCVERVVNMFLAQDYKGEKELIIFNTDEENPYIQTDSLNKLGIKIINNTIDYLTNEPYTNVGAIRRDALTHIVDKNCAVFHADDDDIYLPYYIRQGIDKIEQTRLPSFKPAYSFFYCGGNLSLVKNTMEASVLININSLRKYGYNLNTALEGLAWYTKMRDSGELIENDNDCIPSYCFNWNDGDSMGAAHKQSGNPDNPNNFANHKEASKDICNGELQLWSEQRLGELFDIYYNYILNYEPKFSMQLLEKYLMPNF